MNRLVGTVYNCLYLANVRLPGSVGLAVRVRYVVTESNALSADTALCHLDTSYISPRGRLTLYFL